MENLIKRMQDKIGGVTVKPQKLFLTIISNAFTGNIKFMKKFKFYYELL